jgi:virulence-associated protein VagC
MRSTGLVRKGKQAEKVRRVIKLGRASAITLPKEFATDTEYVVITIQNDKTLLVRPLEVRQ